MLSYDTHSSPLHHQTKHRNYIPTILPNGERALGQKFDCFYFSRDVPDITVPPRRKLELARRHEHTTDTTSESNVPRSLNMPWSVLVYVS